MLRYYNFTLKLDLETHAILNVYKLDVSWTLFTSNRVKILQPFTTEPIFGDLPAPPPADTEKRNVNSSDPLNFDPFGLNDPLPKQEPLLTPRQTVDDGKIFLAGNFMMNWNFIYI